MANKNEIYKIYQLGDLFCEKYNYKQLLLNEFKDASSKESWFFNIDNKSYQLIRVSLSDAKDDSMQDSSRVQAYLDYCLNNFKDDISYLEVFISNEEYDENLSDYDFVNIDTNYADGVDLREIYPEIYSTVHNVEDSRKEILEIIKKMNNKIRNKTKLISTNNICTLVVMMLCIINFIANIILSMKYDSTLSMILLGADYKTFTLGLKQFYRLFTYCFIHMDVFHLFCNLFSLNILGRYIENRFGHVKFLLILFAGVLCGSLTQGILSDNGICVGLSAGVYSLLVVFIIDTFKSRLIDIRSLFPTIFINLFLNFLSNIAWMAHLGGAIAGIVMYYALSSKKDNRGYIILVIVLLLGLFIKYITIRKISSFYLKSDFDYLNLLSDLGFGNRASKLLTKLLAVYEKYGGLQ